MIELKDVTFAYGNRQILNNFNLSVKNGECVQLLGESGCGKTTVARIILGLEKNYTGIVTVPEKISAVFQEDRLIENVDVKKNLQLVLNSKQYSFAEELLKKFEMHDTLKKRVNLLSGGMKRRIALIRAIAFGGDALVLDEAFNGIDLKNKQIAAEIIKNEFLLKEKTVLLITHVSEDAKLLSAKTVVF